MENKIKGYFKMLPFHYLFCKFITGCKKENEFPLNSSGCKEANAIKHILFDYLDSYSNFEYYNFPVWFKGAKRFIFQN